MKVSVIVPVYNVEDYLPECLESIINQTYGNMEILCIDDCSADNSLMILERYAQKDQRIIILKNEENRGQAYSRNIGLKRASGDYILFVDSDDRISLDLLERCVEVCDGCDMVCFDYRQMTGNRTVARQNGYRVEEGVYEGKRFFIDAVQCSSIIFAPWSRLIRRGFLLDHHIFFYDGIIYEDILFSFYCYIGAKTVYSLNRQLYEYRIRNHSTMTNSISEKNIASYMICICELSQFYLQADFEQEMNGAIEGYIQKVVREYISIYRKWESRESVPQLLKDKADYLKLYRLFSELFVKPDKLVDISPRQIDMIRQYQYVLLFGAGDIARGTIECLEQYDIPLYGIVVSSKRGNRKSLMGNTVRELWEYDSIKDKCLVLIGTIPRYYFEIEKYLQEQGFVHWMEIVEG